MWFNFRQMCYNSQVFLTTQSQEVVDIDQELEDLQTIRTKFNSNKKSQQEIIECLDDNNATEIIYEDHSDDNLAGMVDESADGVYMDSMDHHDMVDEVYDDYGDSVVKNENIDIGNLKLENVAEILKESGDLLEALTEDDYDEAMEYLHAEDDEQLEEFIDHCATKNVAIRQLNAKALLKNRPKFTKRPVKVQPKEEKDQKKLIKLPKPSTFMCNICGNVYSKKPLFQHHMRMHSDVKPYQCE